MLRLKNGTFNLTSEHDGIQAENDVLIENGTLTITSGGGSKNSTKIGVETEVFLKGKFMKPGEEQINIQGEEDVENTEDTASYKAIKAQNNIDILGGKIKINSADDSIHSNGALNIGSVTIKIDSGDDGIHADDKLVIKDNAVIDITKSYEGIEANNIVIDSGKINIVSNDDGINVAGGADESSLMGRPGQNSFSENSDTNLEINGGTIYVDSTGDGLDSNGSVYINGGIIYVDGPTDGANGALDYENKCLINGGELIAVGSAQMAQSISNDSKINCLNLNLSQIQSAETTISITDSNNNEILTYTPSKEYQSAVIATANLLTNETYNVNINGNAYTSFTITSIITTIGNNPGMGEMMGPRR